MTKITAKNYFIKQKPEPAHEYEIADRYVSMSNALTRAAHGLTLGEKRIIALAASGLDSKRNLDKDHKYKSIISAADYAETYSVSKDVAYVQLADAANNLFKRHITFFTPAFRRNGKPLPDTKTQMRWVGSVTYEHGEGWVELSWVSDLMRHLVGLKGQFTTYQLNQATALRSAYSWKLLELLMKFKGTGWAEYTIEDFCASMEATDKMRADFGAIRKRIIEPAVKELIAKDHWEIVWKPLRHGTRKVTGVRFEFKRTPQSDMFDLNPTDPATYEVDSEDYSDLE